MRKGFALVLALAFAAPLARAQSITGGGSGGGGGGGGISFSGAVTNGNCAQIAGASQLSDSGAPCGSGLPSIANGNIISNVTGASHVPSGNTLSATIDMAIGLTSNDFLYRGASAWSLGSFGTGLSFSGGVLSAAVTSIAGRTGAVTLSSGDISGLGALATQSTPCTIAQGCTGAISLTAHGVVVGEGTGAAAATAAGAANSVLIGNGGSADPSFATLTATLDAAIGSTRGAILERGASGWALVTPGTSGFALTSNGAAADPSYQAAPVVLNATQLFTKSQGVQPSTLTDAATITPDFAASNNFALTIGGNRTLANATNVVAGFTYHIIVTEDGTGSRNLSYGANYKWPGGQPPTLSTAAGAIDMISCYVADTSHFLCGAVENFQ